MLGARVVFKLRDEALGGLPASVRALLHTAGATDVRAPHRELPGVYVASVLAAADADGLATALRAQPEVAHAEVEAFGSAF